MKKSINFEVKRHSRSLKPWVSETCEMKCKQNHLAYFVESYLKKSILMFRVDRLERENQNVGLSGEMGGGILKAGAA